MFIRNINPNSQDNQHFAKLNSFFPWRSESLIIGINQLSFLYTLHISFVTCDYISLILFISSTYVLPHPGATKILNANNFFLSNNKVENVDTTKGTVNNIFLFSIMAVEDITLEKCGLVYNCIDS